MVRADVFLRAPWRFSAVRLRRALHFLAWIRAAGGGGAGSSYFKYSGPNRKAQARASRLASLGGQNVLQFRAEFELAISHSGKCIFGISTSHIQHLSRDCYTLPMDNTQRRWLSVMIFCIGLLFSASLIIWWFYLMASWPILISVADNPNNSRIPAYLIWTGFGSYPILVAIAFALSWKMRAHLRVYVPVLVALLPIASIVVFLAGSAMISAREESRFEKFAQQVERTPNDFVCPDGRYVQVDDGGTVTLVNRVDDSIEQTWVGNVDFSKKTFVSSPPPSPSELAGCLNMQGQEFLQAYVEVFE